jgi:hypothetical protein
VALSIDVNSFDNATIDLMIEVLLFAALITWVVRAQRGAVARLLLYQTFAFAINLINLVSATTGERLVVGSTIVSATTAKQFLAVHIMLRLSEIGASIYALLKMRSAQGAFNASNASLPSNASNAPSPPSEMGSIPSNKASVRALLIARTPLWNRIAPKVIDAIVEALRS